MTQDLKQAAEKAKKQGARPTVSTVLADGSVVEVQTLRPRMVSRFVWRARFCIELRAGRASECAIGIGTKLVLG